MRSNIEWEEWGKRDPLYGVAAWAGKEQDGPHPWTDAEFYAVGATDWSSYRTRWDSYGRRSGRCLEVGCGAGRITAQLVDWFEEVVGVDVSEGMIARARQALDDRARFMITDGVHVPLETASVDAVFLTFVFQHFDSPLDAHSYWCEIARVLRLGGTIMVQLPVHSWPRHSRIFRILDATMNTAGMMRAHLRRHRLAQGRGKPFMRTLSYDRDTLLKTLLGLGFDDIELCTFRTRTSGAFHTFIFARRV